MKNRASIIWGIGGAFLGGVFVFVVTYVLRIERTDQEIADLYYERIGQGVSYATWTRKGAQQDVIETAERQMLRSMRVVANKYRSHPGRGYWFSRIDRYVKEFKMNISEEDRKLINMNVGAEPPDAKVFYNE